MARPETHADIADDNRYVEVARFQTRELDDKPALMKLYSQFADLVLSTQGRIEKDYYGVSVRMPKDAAQLDDQLKSDQYTWDDKQKGYNQAQRNEFVPSYRRESINRWAREEGFPEITEWAPEPEKETENA